MNKEIDYKENITIRRKRSFVRGVYFAIKSKKS
jgi:hypothetical protein